MFVLQRMVNEIIVAFLGPLPLSRRPKSKPFTPWCVNYQSNRSGAADHPPVGSGRLQVTARWVTARRGNIQLDAAVILVA